jgi:ribonuclease HI
MKYNLDGVEKGNPGPAGERELFRDKNGSVLNFHITFLETKTNNQAEIKGLVLGPKEVLRRGFKKIVLKGIQS